MKKYADHEVEKQTVLDSVEHYRSWRQSYDLEDLDWTRQLLENSCSDELKDKINEEMLDIDPIHHGGPTFFYVMIHIIVQKTDQATRALLQRLKTLSILEIRV